MLLGLPALRGLRRRFPDAEITLVAPLPQARVACWEHLVDRVVSFDEPALAPLVAGTAREWPAVLSFPDLAVVWLRDHATVVATAERLRVAHAIGCAPLDAIAHRRHMAQWLGASVAPLGARPEAAVLPTPSRAAPPRVVIHPGSGSARKNWSGWADLVRALRPEHSTVVAGPADDRAAKTLLDQWPSGVSPPALLFRLSLEELGGVLANASLYLGNDSGVTHLAAAVGAPTVAVFGPTDPHIWEPVGPRVITVGGTEVRAGIFAETPDWPTMDEVIHAAAEMTAQAE